MLKNKGFTLIELLTVIVLIGIILFIAVPSIFDIVSNVKLSAYVKSDSSMLRAAKNYVSSNEGLLPINIGDTVEIPLIDIQQGNFIGVVKDPYNNNAECGGYVLVTKISKIDYDYTTHLNCGDSSSIQNSVADRLVAHWKFNDFQEPTDNLIRHISVEGHGSSWALIDLTHNELPVYRNIVTSPNTGNNFGFRMAGSNIMLNQDASKHITISFYNHIITSPGNTHGYVRVRYTDGTEQQHSWVYTDPTWYNRVGIWQKVVGVATLNASKTPERIVVWYVYRDSAPSGEMYVSGIQIEQKAYDTEYTDSVRSGVVKDYSSNNNNINLGIATTPRWQNNTYNFSGNNTYMSLPNNLITTANIRSNGATYSVWVRPSNLGAQRIFGQQTELGYSDYSSGGIGISASNTAQMMAYSDAGPAAYLYAQGTTVLEANNLYHIVGTYDPDGNQLKIYLNGKLDGPPVTVGVFSRLFNNNANRIGNRHNPTSYPYRGLISDIRLYNRPLSEIEINYLFEKEKVKN